MHGLHERHYRFRGVGGAIQVTQESAANTGLLRFQRGDFRDGAVSVIAGREKSGNIDAFNTCQTLQERRPVFSGTLGCQDGRGNFPNRLLAIAQQNSIKKRRQRFRIIGTGAASQQQRMGRIALGSQ